MAWIKITDVGGPDFINLEQIYKIIVDVPARQLTFVDSNSILPTVYTFATVADLNDWISKFSSITKVIDIDALAPQA